MAKFTADIPETRYYPVWGITINPGDVVDLPADTEAFGLTPAKASKTKSEPDATPAPAETPAPETTDATVTEGVTN
jgi:hypothetical protein